MDEYEYEYWHIINDVVVVVVVLYDETISRRYMGEKYRYILYQKKHFYSSEP